MTRKTKWVVAEMLRNLSAQSWPTPAILHLQREAIWQFAAGSNSGSESDADVQDHLAACARCYGEFQSAIIHLQGSTPKVASSLTKHQTIAAVMQRAFPNQKPEARPGPDSLDSPAQNPTAGPTGFRWVLPTALSAASLLLCTWFLRPHGTPKIQAQVHVYEVQKRGHFTLNPDVRELSFRVQLEVPQTCNLYVAFVYRTPQRTQFLRLFPLPSSAAQLPQNPITRQTNNWDLDLPPQILGIEKPYLFEATTSGVLLWGMTALDEPWSAWQESTWELQLRSQFEHHGLGKAGIRGGVGILQQGLQNVGWRHVYTD